MLKYKYASVEVIPLRGNKKLLFCILSAFLNLLFSGQVVFAAEEITVTISSDTVDVTTAPGFLTSESQTVTISTTHPTGYNGILRTLGTGTALINQDDNTHTIPTFTLPSGASSLPANNTGYGYGYSIDGGANYFPVPDPSEEGDRIFSSDTSGTRSHSLTFGLKPPINTRAGVYEKEFTIAVVASEIIPCSTDTICYHGNGDDGTGTMEDQAVTSNTNTMLVASNFSRPGYGFAGWNTKSDGTGTNYGPNETINTGDLSTLGLELYANWIAPSGNIQNWAGCSSLGPGEIIALRDVRDGEVYTISKLADGNCWMTENMRLDPHTASISKSNTNKPTDDFINKAPGAISTNAMCANNNAACIDTVGFNMNNLNRNLAARYNLNGLVSWYSYGGTYNWYTATAGNGTFSKTSNSVNGDICPAGWHIPTGNNGGEVANYINALNGSNRSDTKLRKFPNNFTYSGDFNTNVTTGRGIQGRYWTTTAQSANNAYRLGFNSSNGITYTNAYNKWVAFSVRCIANTDNQSLNGNIHYDANGGTGTMADDIDVNLYATTAEPNAFTHEDYVFSGWNTSADGTGVSVVDGDMVSGAAMELGLMPGDTLTLFAVWGEQSTLAYNANGGIGAPDDVTVTGVGSFQFTISSVVPRRLDYVFLGWSRNPLDTTPEYATGATYNTNLKQNTLYAVWEKEKCPANNVCYKSNGATIGTSLKLTPSSGVVNLMAFDYRKPGYGFAGWNSAADGSGVNYGAQEKITITDDLSVEGKDIFANWVASTGDMQTWNECSTLPTGRIIALTDSRDNNTYAITKLADGHCWMIENLRLDFATANITSENTNLPTASFITEAKTAIPINSPCTDNDSSCVDKIQYNTNNINQNLAPDPKANNGINSWYGYGVLYNWYSATAGNGTSTMASGSVTGDICPAGWRLPTGGNGGEFVTLNAVENGGKTNDDSGLKKYPVNIVYSGDRNGNTDGNSRAKYTRYWSSTATSLTNAYRFGMQSNNVTPKNNWNKWDAFAIRCIKK